jgi:hypothetical protein
VTDKCQVDCNGFHAEDCRRPVSDASETPLPYGNSQEIPGSKGGDHADDIAAWPARSIRTCADPSETLALIAEHNLALIRLGSGWVAMSAPEAWSPRLGEVWLLQGGAEATGPTIGDAVRACVQRIREASRE